MKTVDTMTRLGITAVAALTILTLPTWASEKGGQGAKPGTSHCDCPSHVITTQNCDRIRSAKPGGTLSPLDLLVLHNYEQDAAGQGQGRGALVGQGADPMWLPGSPWSSIQRYGRFTGRYLAPPNYMGNEIWIRTTEYPRGLKKVTVRNSFGQPINWGLEEDTRLVRGLLATD